MAEDVKVMATLVDENTLDFNGTLFVRRTHGGDEEEVLLMPMDDTIVPKLRCTNCGYQRAYFYWYHATGYTDRVVNYCPGCGYHVAGVLGR